MKVLLQEIRKSRGLSQNDLARLTKMSPQNIQKIEQGEAKSLTFATLSRFCQALNCQPGDLLIYEDELETEPQLPEQQSPQSSTKTNWASSNPKSSGSKEAITIEPSICNLPIFSSMSQSA